ncbi:outer membrane protein assembly factor BamA [Candidatus Vallotia tarda]|uniref:Outer membrane protein assembly factor BamA n=1 Tax=Candidatus Vallotiella hemipterorum TaxID=1177213 RepID=A0A916JTB6_9BURK|nr:outer membrane protein assembly factor BamA [Candidatus Vallotia tarda]CAG7602167.1 Outer membrane protein assembly factor BamA [Candidatus Vallotia tarda]
MFKNYRFIPKMVIAAVLSLYSINTHAIAPFVVKDIRLTGLQQIEPNTVLAYLPIKQGDMFDDEKGSKVIHKLYSTGFFSDVKVLMKQDILIVNVRERPVISSIDFIGVHEFNKENLTGVLQSVGLSSGRQYDKAQLEKATQEVKRQYLTHGYYASEVKTTAKLINIGLNRVSILFSIVEGPSAKIQQINFIGNKTFSTRTLYDEMRSSTLNWFSWYTKNDLYLKEKFIGDLENIRSYYLNRGYLEFNIDSTQVSISPNKKDIYLTVTLYEGQPYKISCINFAGNFLNKEAELSKLIQLKRGDYCSEEKLRASITAIIEKLGEYGYAFASVHAQSDIDREHDTVKVTLHVDPSHRVYVRRVNIIGNSKTRDEVIRREMRQLESSWFDIRRLMLSKDRINRLGYFTDVNLTTIPVEGTRDQVDIDLKVIEKPTGAILLSAGLSSTNKIMLSGAVSQDNFCGSGKSLSLSINTASAYRTLAFTQIDPSITIDGIKRIINIYYRTSQPIYYQTDSSFKIITAGGDLKFGIPFSESSTIYFGAGVEQNRLGTKYSLPQSYIDYINRSGRVSNSVPITVGWSSDTRDNIIVPSCGYYAQANIECGSPIGKSQYYKADLQMQYYYSFTRGFVLGLNLRGGYGNGLSGKPYPIFKNYFAGGIGSVRGYKPISLGPRDKLTNDPIGGSKMIVGSIELMFPLPQTDYDRTLRVFTFLDGGNVWGTGGNSLSKNSLRYSYGLGLAWISPIGPLKLGLGFPLIKHKGDQYQRFQFQIGTAF